MRLNRTYVDAPLAPGDTVVLSENATAHLVRVLRLGLGDACLVFNGDGADYAARLVSLGRRGAEAEIMARQPVQNESPLDITLAQSIARGEKMDWLLQKATELGVTRFVPLFTERTEVKLDPEREEKRLRHWRAVVAAGCEQSGRARLPSVVAPQSLRDWLASQTTRGWFLDPDASTPLQQMPAPDGAIAIVVGPEGGFGERDISALRAAEFEGLRLGPRILRTETAGLAVIAALQARFGDMG